MRLCAARRDAISATSSRASVELGGARQFARRRARRPAAARCRPRPKVAGPMLPTSSGTPLRSRLARAWLARSWLSAAKPTQNSALAAGAATAARMSGFSVSSKFGGTLPAVLLDLVLATALAGRQSATAAVATNTSVSCGARQHGVVASPAPLSRRCASRRAAWAGCTGPATSVTSAPASRAARAMAKPILPLDRLVMPRTGSIASKVGPAVTSTLLPASRLGWKKRDDVLQQLGRLPACGRRRSRRRPGRRCRRRGCAAPSARSCAMLRCVAGCAHISRFIAGASSSGTVSIGRARHIRLSSSSARPCSSLAMKSALPGATSDRHRPRATG